jgi:predicted amidohydrolase
MQIVIYQGEGKSTRVHEILDTIRSSAFLAAEQGADLIIFPEMFLTGYNIGDAV